MFILLFFRCCLVAFAGLRTFLFSAICLGMLDDRSAPRNSHSRAEILARCSCTFHQDQASPRSQDRSAVSYLTSPRIRTAQCPPPLGEGTHQAQIEPQQVQFLLFAIARSGQQGFTLFSIFNDSFLLEGTQILL